MARTVSIHPAVIDAQVRPAATCPADPPLLAPVNLVIDAGDVAALTLSRVQMQFVDTLGLGSGITTFTHADLASRFGSPPFRSSFA